jgi:uncharacterized protein YgiM (DUF1202 family)
VGGRAVVKRIRSGRESFLFDWREKRCLGFGSDTMSLLQDGDTAGDEDVSGVSAYVSADECFVRGGATDGYDGVGHDGVFEVG